MLGISLPAVAGDENDRVVVLIFGRLLKCLQGRLDVGFGCFLVDQGDRRHFAEELALLRLKLISDLYGIPVRIQQVQEPSVATHADRQQRQARRMRGIGRHRASHRDAGVADGRLKALTLRLIVDGDRDQVALAFR